VKTALRVLIAGLVVLVLVAYMCTFTVRYTESAVRTTFGSASEQSVKTEPGLYFKAPWPVQNVTTYDTRVRLLDLKVETQQTRDNRTIAVEAFCTWRVSNPLRFFQKFSSAGERSEEHYARAEEALRASLRGAAAEISNYSMDELFTTTQGSSKLPELEAKMLAAFMDKRDQADSRLGDYGIEAVSVGITRIQLPQEVSKAVFDRMRAGRERLAREIESQGQSQAQAIRDKASADARRITAFAEALAQNIRTQGDLEARPFLAQMNDNPELAVFMQNMEFIRKLPARTATLVLPSSLPGFDALMPDYLKRAKAAGQAIPSLVQGESNSSVLRDGQQLQGGGGQ
jgi:membrane protease subunit HflC